MRYAILVRVRGVVQGVGFRPFVYRLAREHGINGWVLNGDEGIEIHAEATDSAVSTFVDALKVDAPPAARISEVDVRATEYQGFSDFTIHQSRRRDRPTVRISPDLPVCDACLNELFDPSDGRYLYPYINCTNCGPRYSVILSLPYDRPNTTVRAWPLDEFCSAEYHDPANRRFHAQTLSCPRCGPSYLLLHGDKKIRGETAVSEAANLVNAGMIVALKGLGGYHLACDARNAEAVIALRVRKFRKEKPFALMARNVDVARSLVELSKEAENLLTSTARPIVLAEARVNFDGVAPDNNELGVMLPYTPLQHLLFHAGSPDVLVMTSANRSNEPIAYEDHDARDRLNGIADAFLMGERPIARRVDDSVARLGTFGPVILRRARGYAPGVVATLPSERPILALGADLKNTITLVVDGQAFVSQHIGDLDHYDAHCAFRQTIDDLLAMYDVEWRDLVVVHDAHPQYVSTQYATTLSAFDVHAVQHHRAHVASVLAEHAALDKRVLGVSFDGTGYGDDGTIWGGEFFIGSVADGFKRIAHLRPTMLPGGDAAAELPPQAAAGFLAQLSGLPNLAVAPFDLPSRYEQALRLVEKDVRCFASTSVGRLFDCAAALLGFTREISFEGQAAMGLEHLARRASTSAAYPFPFAAGELDFRPLLNAVISDRLHRRDVCEIARAFQKGIAQGIHNAATALSQERQVDTLVFSGGVFQNELLVSDLKQLFEETSLRVWINHAVPPNDGGISLGQAALAAMRSKSADIKTEIESVTTLV